jgi:hemoglobin
LGELCQSNFLTPFTFDAIIQNLKNKNMESQTLTVFEKIGGMAAVNAAVNIFYGKVLADERINGFFKYTNMMEQSGKQKAFLAYAFGAPMNYTGKSMKSAHAHLVENGLNDSHFDAVAGHLVSTLQELNVATELINEVIAIAEITRNDILGK